MGQKVSCPPGDTAPLKDRHPLKFQKSSLPENMLLQNSPVPLISGWGSYPEGIFLNNKLK